MFERCLKSEVTNYKEVTIKDILLGKEEVGLVNLFGIDTNLVLTLKGNENERYIYMDRVPHYPHKKTFNLEMIIYENNIYIVGSNMSFHFRSNISDDVDKIKEIVKLNNMNIFCLDDMLELLENKFKEKTIKYLLYEDFIDKGTNYSKGFLDFIDSSKEKVKEEQYSDALNGVFEEKDIFENIWIDRNNGYNFTFKDIIKYYNDDLLLNKLVKNYCDNDWVIKDRFYSTYLYNHYQKQEQPDDVKEIKKIVDAFNKAGKTANVLIDNEWIKVDNIISSGGVRSSNSFYNIDEIEAVKFNGKVLYKR